MNNHNCKSKAHHVERNTRYRLKSMRQCVVCVCSTWLTSTSRALTLDVSATEDDLMSSVRRAYATPQEAVTPAKNPKNLQVACDRSVMQVS